MAIISVPNLGFGLVESGAALEEVYRLRYAVWVEEFRHAPAKLFPDGQVKDEFDPMAVHAGAFRDQGVLAAARLILHSDRRLPFYRVVKVEFPGQPGETGELSHIVISKTFRRRKEDGLYGAESYLKQWEGGVLPDHGALPEALKMRKGPAVALGLLRVLYQASKRQGLQRWLLMADRKLLALLRRYGFPFQQVADAPKALPGRIPTAMVFEEFESRLHRLDTELFWEFMDGLEEEYRPAQGRKRII